MMRMQLLAVLFLFGVNGLGAASCEKKNNTATQTTKSGSEQTKQAAVNQNGGARQMNTDIETLSGGSFSIANSFLTIARDAETYAALRALSKNGLPELNADYFNSHAVIAAFLGQRRTGGYGVRIAGEKSDARKIVVEELTPPKGSMVAQVFTAPYKVVSVSINANQRLQVAVGNTWKSAARPFQITTGEFTSSGGIAGRSDKFQMQGTVGVLREGNLVTFLFEANGVRQNAERGLTLQEIATGTVDSSGNITVKRMESGTFVPLPHSSLQARGKFEGDAESKFSLIFTSLPANVSDGYNGNGKLEATASAPPQPKRQIID